MAKRKNNKRVLAITFVSIFILTAFILSQGFTQTQFLGAGTRMAVSHDVQPGVLNAAFIGGGNPEFQSGKLVVEISEPSSSDEKDAMWCRLYNELTGGSCSECPNYFDNGVLIAKTSVQACHRSLLSNAAGNKQFLVMRGYSDDGKYWETHGICELPGTKCTIYAANLTSDFYENHAEFTLDPTSTKIYFKEGGYTEQEGIAQFNLYPTPITENTTTENQTIVIDDTIDNEVEEESNIGRLILISLMSAVIITLITMIILKIKKRM